MNMRYGTARNFKVLDQRAGLPSNHRFTVRDPSGLEAHQLGAALKNVTSKSPAMSEATRFNLSQRQYKQTLRDEN